MVLLRRLCVAVPSCCSVGLGTAELNLSSLYSVTLPSTDMLGKPLKAISLPVAAIN
jgi:hypothetical protein